MEIVNKYENYPLWVAIPSNLVSLTIYVLGFFCFITSENKMASSIQLGVFTNQKK